MVPPFFVRTFNPKGGFEVAWETYIPPREKKRQLKAIGIDRQIKAKRAGLVRKADYGRDLMYRNERQAWKTIPCTRKELTLEELRERTNQIFADKRVLAIDPYPGEEVMIESSVRDGAVAYVFERRIRFGNMRCNLTLLHEIAHVLQPYDLHGYKYCNVYCQLIEWFEDKASAEHMRIWLS